MNTLAEDFNEFISARLSHIENNARNARNEFVDILERTLNPEQKDLLIEGLDFENHISSIIEENAYRQGILDAIHIMCL